MEGKGRVDGAGEGREGSETEAAGAWVWTGLWMGKGKGRETGGAWVWTRLGEGRDGKCMGVDGAIGKAEGRGRETRAKKGREGSETGGAWVWTGLGREEGGARDGGAWVWRVVAKEGRERDGRCVGVGRGERSMEGANAAPCFAAERCCASGAILRD